MATARTSTACRRARGRAVIRLTIARKRPALRRRCAMPRKAHALLSCPAAIRACSRWQPRFANKSPQAPTPGARWTLSSFRALQRCWPSPRASVLHWVTIFARFRYRIISNHGRRIEHRLDAAAQAGFAIALYNPVSRARPWQFTAAVERLRRHLPPTTPVILGHAVGRPDERVVVSTLEHISKESADMATLVIVGTRETRVIERPGCSPLVYTPRAMPRAAAEAIA
jgi:hypothetical protein